MSLAATVQDRFDAVRQKTPWLDHLVQAGRRYGADQGNQLAAAVTYFSFLSLFPILLLAISILGFVLKNQPDLRQKIITKIGDALPGGSSGVISNVIDSRKSVGLVGLLGLLYSGLGWVDNLRIAIRTVWHQNVSAGNIVKTKLADLVVLAGLGLALICSVLISGVGNAATSYLVKLVGLEGLTGVAPATKLLSILLAMVADVVIVLWLFIRLPRVQSPIRRILRGAVFAAVGFEILKILGAYYIQHSVTSGSKTYGSIAVVLGALVWINLVSRYLLFSAVWTVTAPYDDDVAPSGTADRETARRAGIPAEFADASDGSTGSDPSPNTRQQDSAPTPLTPALQGTPGVGYGGSPDPRAAPAGPDAGAGTAAGPGAGRRIAVIEPYAARPLPYAPADRPGGRVRSRTFLAGVLGAFLLGNRTSRRRRG